MEWVTVGRYECNFRGKQISNATEDEVKRLINGHNVSIIDSPYVGAFTLESNDQFPDNLLYYLKQNNIYQQSPIYPEGRL